MKASCNNPDSVGLKFCTFNNDCIDYPNSVCDPRERSCKCLCGYRWDYKTLQCRIEDDNFWTGRANIEIAMLIAILVIVILIAIFTLPTCVALVCFKSK